MLDVMPRCSYTYYRDASGLGHNIIEHDNDALNLVELWMRVREDCLRWTG